MNEDFKDKSGSKGPPRWAQKLLEWYCRPELLEDLLGDLNEYYDRHCKTNGRRTARLIYVLDVFKFFRSYTVRRPQFLNFLIHWFMLGSYLKTSGRSILRNKLFSSINIIGLAVSMSVGLVLVGLLSDMSQYDKFHANYRNIYRVTSKYQYLQQEPIPFASTSPVAGKEIQESVPGFEKMAVLHRGFEGDMTSETRTMKLTGLWANESLFEVFTFPLTSGSAANALTVPYSVVLTESSAKKLFGDNHAVGKTLIMNGKQEYTVTAVMKDVPKFSHMRFDILCSLNTREIEQKDNQYEMSWENIWDRFIYLKMPDDANIEAFRSRLSKISTAGNETIENTKIELGLQPLSSIALGEDLSNSIGDVMSTSDVWMIGVLAFVVILSACFNYTNLSIARSLRRTREVGIRKVIGALKSHVFGQFIVEAVLISVFALVIAFGMFTLLKPFFLSLKPSLYEMLTLDISPRLIFYFLIMSVVVGVISGFLPALFFSRMNAITVLKNSRPPRSFGNINVRKTLIVLQYTISLAFIATTIIGYKYYRYLLTFDLGYTTENILNINLQGNKADLLAKELSEIPEVKGISASNVITGLGNYWTAQVKGADPLDSGAVNYNKVDENYIPLHNIKLIAGRNFTRKTETGLETEVIVNEELLKRFNVGERDPQKAIDEVITINRQPVKIIGVIKDFRYGKAGDHERGPEVVFRYGRENANHLNVKVVSTDWMATLTRIEDAWRKIDDVHPLNANLYDDQIKRSYSDTLAMLKMIGFLAFVAISIASMGLLGMVVFTTETRLREISIRKVLGATEIGLVFLLSRNFILLLLIAAAIALPATYLFFEKIAFAESPNHPAISIEELLLALLAVLAFAGLLTGWQTLRAARINPADTLKAE